MNEATEDTTICPLSSDETHHGTNGKAFPGEEIFSSPGRQCVRREEYDSLKARVDRLSRTISSMIFDAPED